MRVYSISYQEEEKAVTNWEGVIEEHKEAILNRMREIEDEMEGHTSGYHKALAIKPSGELLSWEYIGTYSCPESVWRGDNLLIHRWDGWDWTECVNDWPMLIRACADTHEEGEAIVRGFDDFKGGIGEYMLLKYPDLHNAIKESVISNEMDYYEPEIVLDELIRNL